MSTEWKPGDVAMVTSLVDGAPDESVRIRTAVSSGWTNGINWVGVKEDRATARRLVIIDPENRGQVERLAVAYAEHGERLGYARDADLDASRLESMKVALREFANPTPPKPDEPMGLGAVVVDMEGLHYIRTSLALDKPWQHEPSGSLWHWEMVDAVTVLSEGVQ